MKLLRVLCSLAAAVLMSGVALYAQPGVVPDSQVVKYKTFGFVSPGMYMVAPVEVRYAAMLDNSGYMEHAWRSVNGSTNLRTQDSFCTVLDYKTLGMVVTNSIFEPIDTIRLVGTPVLNFHEGYRLPNGNYILQGTDTVTRDMSSVVDGGKPRAKIQGASIQELTPAGELAWEWRSLDHVDITEATEDVMLNQNTIDYIHMNSIELDTDGNLLVSCRHLDQVLKIDKSSGRIIWRLGGGKSRKNDFTWLNDTAGFVGFSHGHAVSRLSNGHLLMFDNGNLKPMPRVSRAVEYEIDEQAMTVKAVWSYIPAEPRYATSMGSAQRLDNGNTLICWGNSGTQGAVIASEVDRDGKVLMEMLPVKNTTVPYRVFKTHLNMIGDEDTIATPATYEFSQADSSSGVIVVVHALDRPTRAIVERHNVPARKISFDGEGARSTLPYRWVVRLEEPESQLTATTMFDLATIRGIPHTNGIRLYHRPVEGQGAFTALSSVYNTAEGVLELEGFNAGEYIIGLGSVASVTQARGVDNVRIESTSSGVVLRTTAGIPGNAVLYDMLGQQIGDKIMWSYGTDCVPLNCLRNGLTCIVVTLESGLQETLIFMPD